MAQTRHGRCQVDNGGKRTQRDHAHGALFRGAVGLGGNRWPPVKTSRAGGAQTVVAAWSWTGAGVGSCIHAASVSAAGGAGAEQGRSNQPAVRRGTFADGDDSFSCSALRGTVGCPFQPDAGDGHRLQPGAGLGNWVQAGRLGDEAALLAGLAGRCSAETGRRWTATSSSRRWPAGFSSSKRCSLAVTCTCWRLPAGSGSAPGGGAAGWF